MDAVDVLPTMSPTQQIYDMDRGSELPDMLVTPGLSGTPRLLSAPAIMPGMVKNSTPILATTQDPYLRLGAYTPETDMGNLPETAKPDLTLFCDLCRKFIDLKLLTEHRVFHKALAVLRYKVSSPPENLEGLKRRRAALLRKMRTKVVRGDDTINPAQIQRLNDAYEFLKADLEDTFDVYRRIPEQTNTDVRGIALSCSAPCAPAVGICSHGNERWKSTMEDTRVFQDYFGNDTNKSFFGIYDGHNGRFAAEVAANELHHGLLVEMEKFDPKTKCTCTFNMADNYDIAEYDIDEVHSRAASRMTERGELHETSANVIQQIIRTCHEKYDQLIEAEQAGTEGGSTDKTVTAKEKTKKKEKKQKDPFAEKMSQAFKKAHKYTDVLLSYGKDEQSRVRWSGCSSLACVIQNTQTEAESLPEGDENPSQSVAAETRSMDAEKPSQSVDTETKSVLKPPQSANSNKQNGRTFEPPKEMGFIHLGNAGNAHAVLIHGNRAYRLSRDHTPNNPKERSRVLREGGTVSDSERDLRVNSVLSTTRGLGNHGDPSLKRCVITEPYTTSVQIDQYAQLLIMATHGVWEVFSEHEAASLLLQFLPANQVAPPSHLSTSLNFIIHGDGDHNHSVTQSRHSVRSHGNDSTDHSQPEKTEDPQEFVFGNAKNLKPKSNSTIDNDQESKETVKVKDVTAAPAPSGVQKQQITLPQDLQTEAGSMFEGDSDRYSGDGSGNEADAETDILPFGTSSPALSGVMVTRQDQQRALAKLMAERLTQAAVLAGAKDNITVMVVLLPGCGV